MKAFTVLFIAMMSATAFADCITYNGRQYCDTGITASVPPAPPVVYYPAPTPVYTPPPVVYYPAPAYYPPRYYVRVDPIDAGIAVLAGAIAHRIIWGGYRGRDDDYRHHR